MADEANDFDVDVSAELRPEQTDITKESNAAKQTRIASKRLEVAAHAKRVTGRELTEQELNLWIAQMDQLGDL